jgi:hypothetical protein
VPSSRIASAFVSGARHDSDEQMWCATSTQPSIDVTKRYFTPSSHNDSGASLRPSFAASRRSTRSEMARSNRATRPSSTTGGRFQKLAMGTGKALSLVEPNFPRRCNPTDALDWIVIKQQTALARNTAGEFQRGGAYVDQVNPAGNVDRPYLWCIGGPPCRYVDIGSGGAGSSRCAPEHDRELGTRSTKRQRRVSKQFLRRSHHRSLRVTAQRNSEHPLVILISCRTIAPPSRRWHSQFPREHAFPLQFSGHLMTLPHIRWGPGAGRRVQREEYTHACVRTRRHSRRRT